MCNFMGVRVSKVELIRLLQIEKQLGTLAALDELELLKDGFRYSNSAIIRKLGDIDIEIVSAHWEFVPYWIKDFEALKAARKHGIPWLNAKGETVLESKMFRDAALKRRCLVLATHFYEWRHYKPEGAKKEIAYPYVIEIMEHAPFYMAGIWQPWTDRSTGEVMDTFAIITTKANDLMKVIHNKKERMPAILPEQLAYEWITNDLPEDRIRKLATYKMPSEYMNAYTISKNFKTSEDPLMPYDYPELPPLDIPI